MTFRVVVPGSTSNLGAGFDFVGLALQLHLTIEISDGYGPAVYGGTLADFDPGTDLIHQKLAGDGLLDSRTLKVHSEIPIARGLGSSGAAIVGANVAHRLIRAERVIRKEIFDEARDEEGHPDNVAASVYGGLIFVGPEPRRARLHPDLGIALVVPETALPTQEARMVLPRSVPREVAVDQASRAVALFEGLTTGEPDLIGWGMGDVIAVPSRAGLIQGFSEAAGAALEAGAFGVTISGSGSTLLAICQTDKTSSIADLMAAALDEAGNPATPHSPSVADLGYQID
ncbi:MAG: homoserine kinase [Gemmatimonadales bacterium]